VSQNEKPPFVDDSGFEKSLSDLGEGLDGDSRQKPVRLSNTPVSPQSLVRPPNADRRSPAPPPMMSIFPESALLPDPASAPRPSGPPLSPSARTGDGRARSESPESATTAPEARRPLLDLFPPPLGLERGRARAPAIVGAPPPRAVHGRFALQTESALQSPHIPLTYEPFYGLSEKPFSLSTDPKFIYRSTSHERVLQELIDALGRGDGIMLLTGEAGVGKTTLCRSLIEQLGRRTVTSSISAPFVSLDAVLKSVLIDFGVVARDDAARGLLAAATREELTTAIGDFAASLAPLQASAVIVIDEAQNVPPDILEAVAALSEVFGADRRVQIMLIGQPLLASMLNRRPLRALGRKVLVRCRLDPLAAEEVSGYVIHRLAIAGTSARVEFDDGAFAELYAATHGVPRLVNLVCDRAMTRGYEASASVIDDRLIAEAASSLELVPARSDKRRLAQMAVTTLWFIALMLVGAAAAAWVFRGDLTRFLR
jgi:type II secretory pathway predicted ATPase ExeA